MRIEFAQEGGFAYLPGLKRPIALDVDRMAAGEADELTALVQSCRFFELPAAIGKPAAGAADYQRFTLTIESEARRHTVRVLVPIENECLRRLVSAIQRHIKAARATGHPPAGATERPPDR